MRLTTEHKLETPYYGEGGTESWALPNEAEYLLIVLSYGMHFLILFNGSKLPKFCFFLVPSSPQLLQFMTVMLAPEKK